MKDDNYSLVGKFILNFNRKFDLAINYSTARSS